MKKTFIFLILMFLAGVLCMQLLGNTFVGSDCFLNEYHLSFFANQDIERMGLFWNVLWERGKLFLVLAVLLFTPIKKVLPVLSGGFFSFTLGMYSASCVILHGAKGILLFLSSVFPQGIFYLLAIFFLFRLQKPVMYRDGKKIAAYIFSILLIVSIFMVGCIMETTFGMEILQYCVKYLMKNAI